MPMAAPVGRPAFEPVSPAVARPPAQPIASQPIASRQPEPPVRQPVQQPVGQFGQQPVGHPGQQPVGQPGQQLARAGAGFSLTNEDLDPAQTPADAEAGCPSSRCLPRESIAWQELEPWDAWESFLAKISAENDLLWAVLQDLGLVSISKGAIRLASPATGFAQTQLRENPEFRTGFEHFTAEYFGEVMRLEIIDANPSLPHMPSLALVDAERNRRHRAAICSDAERNPRIRSLLSAFGGELLAVEVLEAPPLPPLGQRGVPG
ncbi:hypothetical protein ENSA7_03530 [Enhygromyxa salina]|uniref:DNA polymerase III subunits gamma and tau n=1 Tax=Enhygromyxa salina TaxID=215803 RepID=A0A2S9YXS5_9BACT|nr:hypothetical protein ENSA7_03530 [Enhygromyxa salina]